MWGQMVKVSVLIPKRIISQPRNTILERMAQPVLKTKTEISNCDIAHKTAAEPGV
jgi:hypothetical protein